MNQDDLREYVETVQPILEEHPQMGETATREAVIRKFLTLLGWDGIPKPTYPEYPVPIRGQSYHVDYALIPDEEPLAFIEVKACSTTIVDDHREQLRDYMKQANVEQGLLTNGKEYEFFVLYNVDPGTEVDCVGRVRLEELPNSLPVVSAFTKTKIQQGESTTDLERLRRLRRVRTQLQTDKNALAEDIVEVFEDHELESLSSQVETEAKNLVDQLISTISEELSTVEDSDTDAVTSPTPPVEEEGQYAIQLRNQDGELRNRVAASNQTDAMAKAVNHLIEHHDLISQIEPLPFTPGRKKALINTQPTYPDGEEEMRTYREVGGGKYYLDTHASKVQKKRDLQRLADQCGVEIDTEGEW